MITLTLVALLVAGLLVLRTRSDEGEPGTLGRALDSRWVVLAIGVLSALGMWWNWGSLHPLPVVHDETAYLLQADIFARGRWTAPSPPIPAFFEQAHVLVSPTVAAKYPPGHSLVLAVGALIGWPALVVVALWGIAGALLFVLARRVANGGVALVTWVLWMGSPTVQGFGPSYFSESTTAVCWLAGWYALLEWRATRRPPWLVALSVIVAWGAITRPLTMIAYAIPVAIVVGRDVLAQRRWRDFAIAMAAGCAVLALLPLWSVKTTGSWLETPLSLYTQQYMPWDVPGFGLTETPPSRALTPDMEALSSAYIPVHAQHTVDALPRIAVARLRVGASRMWGAAEMVLLPFALIGLLALGSATAVALAGAVLLLAAYLLYATPPIWTLYYIESAPVFAYLTASGIAMVAGALLRRRASPLRGDAWRASGLVPTLATSALLLALPALASLNHARQRHRMGRSYHAAFARMARTLPHRPAVVFVRYSPDHNPHLSLVRNAAALEREPVWVVYDRGAVENARLLSHAPGRQAYLYDEQNSRVFTYAATPPTASR
jgi:hypothetical protein